MRFSAYIILYIFIALLVIQNQLTLASLAVLLFTYYVSAIWLIPLGFMIDGYFDAFTTVPVFSLVTIIWYAVSEFLKPRLNTQITNL